MKGGDTYTMELDRNAALVLFEFLASRGDELETALDLDAPERNALWVLETALERVLSEPFAPDYEQRLEASRNALIRRFGK